MIRSSLLGIFPLKDWELSLIPRGRMGAEDYEKEGKKFYRLAAKHPSARELGLSEIFWTLYEDFPKAKKPLNFIAEHYLRYKRYRFFG